MSAAHSFLVSRLDASLDLSEFKKICSLIPGKPKNFHRLSKYSEVLLKRQVLIGGFDSITDKKAFLNTFKMIYPDYWIQETSKIVKFFCLSNDPKDSDCDWKEFIQRRFQNMQSVYVATGSEALASDYKLLKNPIMQPYLDLKVVIVEFTSPGDAMNSLL